MIEHTYGDLTLRIQVWHENTPDQLVVLFFSLMPTYYLNTQEKHLDRLLDREYARIYALRHLAIDIALFNPEDPRGFDFMRTTLYELTRGDL